MMVAAVRESFGFWWVTTWIILFLLWLFFSGKCIIIIIPIVMGYMLIMLLHLNRCSLWKIWLKHYHFIVDDNTGKSLLKTLVRFISGSTQLRTDDLFEVKYNSDPSKKLLEASTCFSTVCLPTVHNSYEEFRQCCLTSLLFGGEGFGKF